MWKGKPWRVYQIPDQINKKQVSGYTATGFTFPHLVYSFLFSAIRVMTRL